MQSQPSVPALPVKPTQFVHVPLIGDAYTVGRMQGELARSIPGWLDFIRSGKGAFDQQSFAQVSGFFERYCPGLNAEIQGLADAAGVAPQEVVYYAATYQRARGCNHLVALPPATQDGHVLLARTYDYGDAEDDLRLCTTHIEGKYRHVGFSLLLLGRCDGMNEHGLAVTMSAGGIPVRTPIQDGFQFWALIRALLESCRTVDEGLALIEQVPLMGNTILLLADRSGQAALVETYGPHKPVRRIPAAGQPPYLFATNHYTLPEMQAYQPGGVMHNSRVRAEAIQAFLSRGPANREGLKAFLATEYPAGLSSHFYQDYFGTLHAMLFDLTDGTVEVSFGAPDANPWHVFDMAAPAAPGMYPAGLPQARIAPEFFQFN